MNCVFWCFLVFFIASADANKDPALKVEDSDDLGVGTRTEEVKNKTSMTSNTAHRNISLHGPGLIMLSVEIIKNVSRTNNATSRDGSEVFVIDGDSPDEISLFQSPKASPYFPRFSEISMRTLYLIVCMCLAILLLMIVKLLVSRRERKRDYDLVTKGEFDA